MPLMSGVEVAREARALGSTVYIAGCTGNALREDQDEYLEAGADQIIPKPVHLASVRAAIDEARGRLENEAFRSRSARDDPLRDG